MKSKSSAHAALALIEWAHSAGHYPPELVEAAVHFAGQPAIDRAGRMPLIAAYGLSTWSTVAREEFLAEADLPKSVRDALAADPVVNPEPLPVMAPAEMSEDDIAAYRQRGIADLANRAERLRLSVLTGGAAKAQTYREKLAEVERHEAAALNEEEIDPADYPYLSAEVGVHGASIAEVAALIRAKHVAWTPVNAAIEGLYFAAKADIADPETDIAGIPARIDLAETDMVAALAGLG
ncbi:hypothetical protein AWH62_01015 [Maricaulis sp. W15]|uniref:hypothetical protein n=1 Tax=Maricaulis sp. W15 TaxID=1772333 RepID=UPI000948BD45|nr:hypothetical protein [Maricaulis sp. W15]OLF81287.1 hypothetical protein AWH62_01015 [Maricaulis sp. W15]